MPYPLPSFKRFLVLTLVSCSGITTSSYAAPRKTAPKPTSKMQVAPPQRIKKLPLKHALMPSKVKVGGEVFTEVDIHSIPISWTPFKDASFACYEVHRSMEAHFAPCEETLIVSSIAWDDVEYLDDDVAANTTYYYKIVTFNKQGTSVTSNELKVKTLPPPDKPPAPVKLTVKQPPTRRKVVVAWSKSPASSFSYYELYRSTVPNFKPSQATLLEDMMPFDTTSYVDTDVSPGMTYYYKVVVFDGEGQTGTSTAFKVTIPPKPPLTIPQTVTLYVGTPITDTDVPFTWTRSTDKIFDFYELHRSETPNFTPDEDTWVDTISAVNRVKGADDMAEPSTTYYYKIVVVNESGGRAASNEVSAITAPAAPPRPIPPPPTAVTLKIGTPVTDISVPLMWTRSTTPAFYRYELRTARKANFDPATEGDLVAFVDKQDTLKWVDGVDRFPDSTYYYKVIVVDALGRQAISNEVRVTTKKALPLGRR